MVTVEEIAYLLEQAEHKERRSEMKCKISKNHTPTNQGKSKDQLNALMLLNMATYSLRKKQ
jgi:hypothetical protein